MGAGEREGGVDSQAQMMSEQGGTLDSSPVQFSKILFSFNIVKLRYSLLPSFIDERTSS